MSGCQHGLWRSPRITAELKTTKISSTRGYWLWQVVLRALYPSETAFYTQTKLSPCSAANFPIQNWHFQLDGITKSDGWKFGLLFSPSIKLVSGQSVAPLAQFQTALAIVCLVHRSSFNDYSNQILHLMVLSTFDGVTFLWMETNSLKPPVCPFPYLSPRRSLWPTLPYASIKEMYPDAKIIRISRVLASLEGQTGTKPEPCSEKTGRRAPWGNPHQEIQIRRKKGQWINGRLINQNQTQ